MTDQSTVTLFARIAPAKLDALRTLLATMTAAPGLADPHNAVIPFYQFQQIHMARFTILEALTNDDMRLHGRAPRPWPPTLAFVADIDGPVDVFLAELCIRCDAGLRQIFSHCLGFRSTHPHLLQWLHEHLEPAQATYTNWRGRTVLQVRQEQTLSATIRQALPDLMQQPANRNPNALRQQLRAHIEALQNNGEIELSAPQAAPIGRVLRRWLHAIGIPLLLLALLPIALIVAIPWLIWLRYLERSDPENTERPSADHLDRLVAQEDLNVTNHFNVFGQVKPGLFRRLTIRALLCLLNYAAQHIYHRGYLTRIQTIHFARWVLMDKGRRVYFASNYDGSAESYMDDFINKVAWGLNLVFSNGIGYPRTRFLILGGAEYEQRYKATLRRNQLPSECWYKAYPGLTAVELARNARIRDGLFARHLSQRALRQWAQDL